MSDPTLPLQSAIYSVLTGAAFQAACGVSVAILDHVPINAALPYIRISDIQCSTAAAARYDATTARANLAIYSNAPGKVQLSTIASAVRAFLAPRSDLGAPLSLSGHRLVTWRYLQTIPKDEPDGITVSATVVIEFGTEPL